MSGLLWINDRDVADLGVIVDVDPQGHRDGPEGRLAQAPVQGLAGQVALSTDPVVQPRVITVSGFQAADTREALLAQRDRLFRLVYDGMVRVRFGDLPDREWECVGGFRVGLVGDWINQVGHTVRFRFEAPDPAAEAVATTVVDFATGAVECPLGTMVSRPIIRIGDGATNPVVRVWDHLGQSVATMGLTATLGSGEWLEIDCELQTIYDQDGAGAPEVLTSGDFLGLNPADSPVDGAGPWPTIEASGGGALARAEYRKRYG